MPSSEILLTGSLPSGHDEAYPWIENKDNTKKINIFFITLTEVLVGINYSSKRV